MTSSVLAARRGSQTPRVSNFPRYDLSAAPEVIDLAATAGLNLDEWQCYVLVRGLGMTRAGRYTANKVSCWVPRQNGKGGIIEALELYWLFLSGEELVVHSAHQHRTAQRAYARLESMVRRTPDLHRRVRQYRQANGEQQIELRDGRLLQYTTRSRTALKGFSAPKLILDEAQELTAEQMAAILPTVSAMDNWQAWFFGTPPTDPAAWCYGLRDDGEASSPRLAHFDWGLDLDLEDPADRARCHDIDLAYQTNPALGIRITEDTVVDENKPSGLGDKYPMERLGVWLPRARTGAGVIPDKVWVDQIDPAKKRPTDIALCIQVSYKRTRTAIVAVGARPDGGLLTSIVDWRLGTDWVVDRAVELKALWNPVAVVVQDKGPTGALLADMTKAGLTPPENPDEPRRGDLAIPWADDVADAYALWLDALLQRRLWHLNEAPLNTAVTTAATRPLSGGTAWDYRDDAAAPLLASTFALWGYLGRVDRLAVEYASADVW